MATRGQFQQLIGNQQSEAVGALAEKIVNSIDAINAAFEAGVHPEASDAPTVDLAKQFP